MSGFTDPLAGLSFPVVDPGALRETAGAFARSGGAFDTCANRQARAVAEVSGQSWKGDAAKTAYGAAQKVTDGYHRGAQMALNAGPVLLNCAASWEDAQAKFRRAQQVAAEAVQQEQQMAAAASARAAAARAEGLPAPKVPDYFVSPLAAEARAMATEAISDFWATAHTATGQLQGLASKSVATPAFLAPRSSNDTALNSSLNEDLGISSVVSFGLLLRYLSGGTGSLQVNSTFSTQSSTYAGVNETSPAGGSLARISGYDPPSASEVEASGFSRETMQAFSDAAFRYVLDQTAQYFQDNPLTYQRTNLFVTQVTYKDGWSEPVIFASKAGVPAELLSKFRAANVAVYRLRGRPNNESHSEQAAAEFREESADDFGVDAAYSTNQICSDACATAASYFTGVNLPVKSRGVYKGQVINKAFLNRWADQLEETGAMEKGESSLETFARGIGSTGMADVAITNPNDELDEG